MLFRAVLLAAALSYGAAAQAFAIGTASDPCTGGYALTTAEGQTLRFGDFTCTIPVPADGLYQVTLTFEEPCYLAGACGGGQVAKPGGRLFNVFVNDSPLLSSFDPVASGATNLQIAMRRFALYSAASKFTMRFSTVTRSAVLYSIGVTPLTLTAGACAPIADPDAPSGRSLYCSANSDCSSHDANGACLIVLGIGPWWKSSLSIRLPIL